MKVGLNATCFNDRPSGANQRFKGIYSELIKYLPETEFVIYEPSDSRIGRWFDGVPNVTIRKTQIPSVGRVRKTISSFMYWNSALKDEKFDFFEGFNLPSSTSESGKNLFTLHDVRRLNMEKKSNLDRLTFKALLEKTLKSTDRLITVSKSMKDEILSFYPETPISVVYNGVNTIEYNRISINDQDNFRLKYALETGFLLAVGHYEKRKNYLNLIDAIAFLHKQGRYCHLLIIGNDSGEGAIMRDKIKDLNLSAHVTMLSGLSDLEVRCAYKLCSLFVFTSSYEGFGIPILEAMASGTPIVLSELPVFHEITEGEGVYFSPADSHAIASAIDKVLSSENEKYRLIQYGNKRVQDFNFKKIARDLANVYKSLS